MNYLKIFNKPIIIEAPVYYNNMDRKKNLIRLKKKLLDFFGYLPKEDNLFYRAELHPSFEQLEKRIKELKEEKAIPVFLFLFK